MFFSFLLQYCRVFPYFSLLFHSLSLTLTYFLLFRAALATMTGACHTFPSPFSIASLPRLTICWHSQSAPASFTPSSVREYNSIFCVFVCFRALLCVFRVLFWVLLLLPHFIFCQYFTHFRPFSPFLLTFYSLFTHFSSTSSPPLSQGHPFA